MYYICIYSLYTSWPYILIQEIIFHLCQTFKIKIHVKSEENKEVDLTNGAGQVKIRVVSVFPPFL